MPSPKKKPTAKAAPARERTTIILAGDLLKQIDAIAQHENRPRSRQIEVALREYVANHQQRRSAA